MTFLTFESVVKSAVFVYWLKMIHKICLIRSFFYIQTFCTRNPTGISLGCSLLLWIFFPKKCQISLTFWVSPSVTLHLISFRRLINSNSTSTWDQNCHFFLLWRTKKYYCIIIKSVLNTIVNPNNLLKVCLRTLNVWVKGQEIFDEWVE